MFSSSDSGIEIIGKRQKCQIFRGRGCGVLNALRKTLKLKKFTMLPIVWTDAKKAGVTMIKSRTARIARLPVPNMVATFANSERMSGKSQKTTISDILGFAAKATESREEMKELFTQSRVIVWDLSDIHDNTMIRHAAGMSVPGDELLADMRKRMLAEYSALDDSHIRLYAEESEFSLGDYRISVRNLSASRIISQNPF